MGGPTVSEAGLDQCSRPGCLFPVGGACAAEFADPASGCPNLRISAAPTAAAATPAAASAAPVARVDPPISAPWTGEALTLAEVRQLQERGNAQIIAVLGARNAGKTTLLTATFLQICQGVRGRLGRRFAGSRTLRAWRRLCEGAADWGGQSDQEIVGHTPRDSAPGARRFLHLAMQPIHDDGCTEHLALADVNGESLLEWSVNPEGESRDYLGFLNLARHFIVVADGPLLRDEKGHQIEVANMIDTAVRYAAERGGGGRVVLAVTKSEMLGLPGGFPKESPAVSAAWPEFARRCRVVDQALIRGRQAGLAVEAVLVAAFPHRLEDGQPFHALAPLEHCLNVDAGDVRRWPDWPVGPYTDPFAALVSLRRDTDG